MPKLRRLAILLDVTNSGSVLEGPEVQAAARSLGIEVVALEVRQAKDIAPAFAALKARRRSSLYLRSALVTSNRVRINTLAVGARLPMIYNFRDHAHGGGLLSYGAHNGPIPAGCRGRRPDLARSETQRDPG